MNERDAETLAGILCQHGYKETEEFEDADIIILHTCCVRESAENKILGKIGELKHLKEKKPELIIGVCGCMVQQPEAADKLKARAPHVDIIFGTHNLHQLPEFITQVKEFDQQITSVWSKEGEIVEDLPSMRKDKIKAYVNISYGCDNFCTYCIVPYVRGRERSRKPEAIIAEINKLKAEAFNEVMLLGQNVNSYGKDLEQKMDFADLLRKIDAETEMPRIRFMTSHPRDFNRKTVEAIAESDSVCPQIHLPIQAGSDRILKKMNRGYTREEYLELIDMIKEILPEASLTTDIIVGFPGETEEDFEFTLEAVRRAEYDNAYTFMYSKRSGTPAAEMIEQVEEQIKKDRLHKLIEVQNEISYKKNKPLLGKKVTVLVEGVSKGNPDKLAGRTSTNKIVTFAADRSLIGKFVDVEITETKTWSLEGTLF